ncbi:MAG: 30S ribosomal protein S12 methylthiotransferase RimO [Melioribacteraceae bacterium]|nr:30S ribosomal protein S12 methylthiotransferase RimO [Melioribacteraceae bacterium]
MSNKEKISIVTLGCSKNTVDSERLMNQLKINNFEVVEDTYDADAVIINTCGFIDAAKEESVNTILEAIEAKKDGKLKKVIVSGCLSERYVKDLKKEIPEVDSYYGVEDYRGILKEFGGDYKDELLDERSITTPGHYEYLKISEGCDNPCSFCAIPLIRGKHKSRPIESLISEAASLAKKGVKELVVIGQDTTCYGLDIYGKKNLAELLTRLSEIDGIEWIRLLYTYPTRFPEDILDVIANNPKICKYIDMPLQHVSDNVLKSMRRGITARKTKELISLIKSSVSGITFRTTFIVGYPTETEKDFEELCEFVKAAQFDRFGVFTYSPEDDTTAFPLGDPISAEEKERRKSVLMEIQQEISLGKNNSLLNKNVKVIIDRLEGDYYIGRTERDAPEVDCEVLIPSDTNNCEIGKFLVVEIYDCNEYDLYGNVKH